MKSHFRDKILPLLRNESKKHLSVQWQLAGEGRDRENFQNILSTPRKMSNIITEWFLECLWYVAFIPVHRNVVKIFCNTFSTMKYKESGCNEIHCLKKIHIRVGRQGNRYEKKNKSKGDEGRTHELHGSLLNIKGTIYIKNQRDASWQYVY